MPETGNKIQTDNRMQLVIRIGTDSLSVSVGNPQAERNIVYEPYNAKSGISMAANLRDAFKSLELLMSGYRRVLVLVDSPVMLVPIDEFSEKILSSMYSHTFTDHKKDEILYSILPDLNVVAVFGVNKDLKMVIEDHFKEIRFIPVSQPVWLHLYHRSFTGTRSKLFAHFHDKKVDVFSYANNRFKFCNTFNAKHAHDALYYILYAWRQLGYNVDNDEIHVCGDIVHKDWLLENLRKHVTRAYVINPVADFNRARATAIPNIEYDLLALHLSANI